MSLFLARDELMDSTERKQRAKVVEWLTENGYRFDVAADGWPKVLRSALESRHHFMRFVRYRNDA